MQMIVRVRRGTTSEWAASTKILLVGEIGLDTTLNKIKFGNGSDLWPALPFANVTPAELKELSQDYVAEALVLGTHSHIEVAYDDQTGKINLSAAPEVVISSGLTNTLGDYLTLSDFEALKDNPDGIPSLDSAGLLRDSEIPSNIVRNSEISNIDNTSDLNKPISTATQTALDLKAPLNSPTFTGTVVLPTETVRSSDLEWEHYMSEADLPSAATKHGMFAHVHGTGAAYYAHSGSWYKLGKQSDLDLKSPIESPTFTGTVTVPDLTITGNLTVNGTQTVVDTTNLEITDSLIYLAAEQYDTDVLDIGIYGAYGDAQAGHLHTGLFRDATDAKWKLVSNAQEASNGEISLTGVNYDTLKIGGLELTGTATGITKTMVGLGNVDNTSDETKYKNEYIADSTQARIISSTTDKFKVIEFNNSGAISVTIPNDTQDSGWPVGSYVEIRQIGTGQITIGKDAAVSMYAPDSQFKTRVQWSSLFLEKRATNSWLVTGDATA
jgi:hypothetical protein